MALLKKAWLLSLYKMAADSVKKIMDDSFDENFLFSEFEEAQSKPSSTTFSQRMSTEDESQFSTLEELRAENYRLKAELARLLSPIKCSKSSLPLVQAVYFENEDSILNRSRIEDFFSTLYNCTTRRDNPGSLEDESGDQRTCPKVQPSLQALNEILADSSDFRDDNDAREDSDNEQAIVKATVVSCVRYFELYCVDCCGLPLKDFEPQNSNGWETPRYEQIYFVALPCEEDSQSKVRVSRRKTCFNCGARGHALSNCPEPHNSAHIEAQRKKFLTKFTSPIVKGSRYHVNEKRFGGFKPGMISDNLREALGVDQNEVPPFVYKMRCIGYPPGYLPTSRNKPSLLLYDATGNVDDYIVEEDDDDDKEEEEQDDKKNKSLFIEYPGFNCPLPEGAVDRASRYGFPPMNPQHHIAEMEWWYSAKQLPSSSRSQEAKTMERKRKLDGPQEAHDMDVDDEGITPVPFNLGTPPESPVISRKRGRYDDIDSAHSDGGYSPCHPGLEIGEQEKELLQRFHHDKRQPPPLPREPLHLSTPPPLPGTPGTSSPSKQPKLRKRSDGSKEDGELTDDDEEEYQEYDSQEDDSQEDDEAKDKKGYRDWWIEVPLTTSTKGPAKLSPPPVPAVKLPLDLLTRFYTTSTVLQKISFEDRVMWMDPIYGNIQVSSGRYDKLKEILKKKKKKRRK